MANPLRFTFKPIIFRRESRERCALLIRSEGEEWVGCVTCPSNGRALNKRQTCAKGKDLPQLIRYLIPCYFEYSYVIRRIEKALGIKICNGFIKGGGIP
jgi:hypothetical protein